MNNVCKRNCYWNYGNQCCPEDGKHYKDGTAHTNKCSAYLHKDFEYNVFKSFDDCYMMIRKMNSKELNKAKGVLRKIKEG